MGKRFSADALEKQWSAHADHQWIIYRICHCPTDGHADVYVYYPRSIHFLQAVQQPGYKIRYVQTTTLYLPGAFYQRSRRAFRSSANYPLFFVRKKTNTEFREIPGLETMDHYDRLM